MDTNNKTNNSNNDLVSVIWTDPDTKQSYSSIVDFTTKLDFYKMSNVVLSF